MGKAILVIDMPKCCYECFAFDDSCDHPMCLATEEIRGYTFRAREQKMDKCPLKEMPEKKLDITSDEYFNGFNCGYNVCIDKILGK